MSTPDRTIEVVVSPAGEVVVTAKGFAGPACRDATRALERALGTVAAERPTAEFYQAQAAPCRAEQRT